MLGSLLNKVAGLKLCNFIGKRLQRRCFLVKLPKILRAHILKNICERVKKPQKISPLLLLGKPLLDGKPHN